MAKQYRLTLIRQIANALMKFTLRRGIAPPNVWLLTVHGRKSGVAYSTPVSLIYRDSTRYLVSPYGQRSWVKNARANGKVTLSRGNSYETRHVTEVGGDEAASILRQYYEENPITHSFFDVKDLASDKAFDSEVANHPVFRLA